MSVPQYGISEYLKDLEILSESDLTAANKELLQALKTSWETINCETLKEQIENAPIKVQLFVEDMKCREGPFEITCVPSWTGRTLKEKIATYLHFPVDYQTLLVEYSVIKDDELLKSHGITKEGDSLSVFLLKKDPEEPEVQNYEEDDMQPGPSGLQRMQTLPHTQTGNNVSFPDYSDSD
uniref:Uncharacterized protein LOC100179865 n=1 Tax=Phallusia mammillata TaxID=59560 RepID=A0A6F9DGE1_9ASCI|nr:uncharacterized protein LOC100179865 [Phallusia mammillata]